VSPLPLVPAAARCCMSQMGHKPLKREPRTPSMNISAARASTACGPSGTCSIELQPAQGAEGTQGADIGGQPQVSAGTLQAARETKVRLLEELVSQAVIFAYQSPAPDVPTVDTTLYNETKQQTELEEALQGCNSKLVPRQYLSRPRPPLSWGILLILSLACRHHPHGAVRETSRSCTHANHRS